MAENRSNRQKANALGHWAEIKAAALLLLTGHRIIAMRHKTHSGEIDIIAKKSSLIIITEVKARRSEKECLEAVTPTGQKRIHNAADIWLTKQPHGEQFSVRFDIIAVVPWKLPKHFTNMF